MSMTTDSPPSSRLWTSIHECAICKSKAVGVNFGAPTCSPCKAFFRRNARRIEVLDLPCQFTHSDPLENDDLDSEIKCAQLRRCTSCRLRRCFDVGMKKELVRTDEERQRYRQLIESNRQRRRESTTTTITTTNSSIVLPISSSHNQYLKENDWKFLSSIVSAYDNYCLKLFTENRQNIFNKHIKFSEQPLSKIDHHVATRINIITSFLSFLSSIPIVRSLSKLSRVYLCKHNIRPLVLLNLHEIGETCFTESFQLQLDDIAAEYVYGKVLFAETIKIKNRARALLITDPVVTRIWLLILFFSSPLTCYYDPTILEISHYNRLEINKIQDSLTNLLWSYLLHRHGYFDSIRIFSNFIQIYLQMQRVTQAINYQLRTRNDLIAMHQALNRAIILEGDLS